MTDTTTDLGTIWVVGQRRAPGGTFPPASGAGTGSSGGDGGVEPELVDPDPEDPPWSPPHPCDDPETAREWNADAAAAEAKREFERQAAERGDDGLFSREWHAFLYEDATGRVYVGPVSAGSQGRSLLTPPE